MAMDGPFIYRTEVLNRTNELILETTLEFPLVGKLAIPLSLLILL